MTADQDLDDNEALILSEGICPVCHSTVVYEGDKLWRCTSPDCLEGYQLVMTVEVSRFYQNRKTGDTYQVTAIATHSETLESMVVYAPVHKDGETWVRPMGLFQEKFKPMETTG